MGLKIFKGILCTFLLGLVAVYSAIAQSSNWPAARLHHSGTYDDAHNEFVVYGGYTWNHATQKVQAASDVWAWNGVKWRLISDTGLHKYVASMAYDSKRQRILIFGGADDANAIDGKLRSLEPDGWTVIHDLPSLARADATLVYDSKRDRLVLFGGRHENILFADTWEFDGSDWKPTFMAGPSLRSAAAAVYDSARGVTVLYGGFRPLAGLGDTWEWDGKQWKLVSESGPGPRSWPSLAYDSKRKRTILFGGEDEKGRFYSDTWAWDGRAWSRLATEGPPERIQFVMGYDSARDRVVLFGGVNDKPQHMLNDVWEFDGQTWMEKKPQ
jgi:Galactose oxidase, central domain